ncbi:hypothetical protein DIPPA_13033 [Diplonema papillatum]|nr:hypothetical protein DIPPA_13033 [Diplonema papillatum]
MSAEEDAAAIKVQTLFRGHVSRRRVEQIKYDTARKKGQDYLQKKKIPSLLQHLFSLVTYHQPEDPNSFMLEEIQKLQKNQKTELLCDDDIDTMFEMIDITRQGYVTGTQLRHCATNLSAEVSTKIDPRHHYTKDEFRATLAAGLQTGNKWSA